MQDENQLNQQPQQAPAAPPPVEPTPPQGGESGQGGGSASSSGLTPNLAGALSYFFGPISGIVFLLVEKENKFVRFHAMQSIITFGALFVVNLVLSFIPIIGWAISLLLSVVALVVWLLLMIKAYQGAEYELPIFGKIARDQVGKM